MEIHTQVFVALNPGHCPYIRGFQMLLTRFPLLEVAAHEAGFAGVGQC